MVSGISQNVNNKYFATNHIDMVLKFTYTLEVVHIIITMCKN
jgi:hypothetical protein